jgi:hypothetical protein
MSSKKSLSYTNTIETTNKNKQQQPELSLQQTDFRNIKNKIENNDIEKLKRKIDTITRYQKTIYFKNVK